MKEEPATKADLEQLRRDIITEIDGSNQRHEIRFENLEGQLGHVEGRLSKVEGKLDNVEHRLGSVEGRLGNLETTVSQQHGEVMLLLAKVSDQLDRFVDRTQQEIAKPKQVVLV